MTYNESLRQAQWLFMQHLAFLINKAIGDGLHLSGGELFRTDCQQKEYVRTGLSRTLHSQHLLRLAVDLNIFEGSRLLFSDKTRENEDVGLVKPLGEYWKSLHVLNRWGGDFPGWIDGGHFENHFQ